MIRTALFAAALAAGLGTSASAACRPGDVALTGAVLQSITQDGALSDVHVAVTVKNFGLQKQSGNTLQSVQIFQGGNKVGSKGIPPLGPRKSYTFNYTFQRSPEADRGTTLLQFHLVGDNAAGAACVRQAARYHLSV